MTTESDVDATGMSPILVVRLELNCPNELEGALETITSPVVLSLSTTAFLPAWHLTCLSWFWRVCLRLIMTEGTLSSPSLTPEVLRSIGQDLELRGIKTFVIRCEDDSFTVDGGYQSPPAPMPVSLYYSPNDIRELERKARERNDYLSATRSFIYLPEILSSIASYVQDKEASLLTISNIGSTEAISVIDIEYETLHGNRMSDRLMTSTVYELCVREHKRRARRQNLTDDRFTRFSSLQARL